MFETVNYNSVLCKLFCTTYKFCANYYLHNRSIYSTVCPMKHVESDVIWSNDYFIAGTIIIYLVKSA